LCAVSYSSAAAGSSSLIEVVVGIVDIIIIEEEGAVVEIIIIMELLGCWLDGGKSQAMADAETLPTGEPSRPLLPAGRPL